MRCLRRTRVWLCLIAAVVWTFFFQDRNAIRFQHELQPSGTKNIDQTTRFSCLLKVWYCMTLLAFVQNLCYFEFACSRFGTEYGGLYRCSWTIPPGSAGSYGCFWLIVWQFFLMPQMSEDGLPRGRQGVGKPHLYKKVCNLQISPSTS